MSLHTLPDDIISYILIKLPVEDISSCLRTCRAIRDIGNGDYLWNMLAQRDLSPELFSLKTNTENWHDFCKLHLSYPWKKLESRLQSVCEVRDYILQAGVAEPMAPFATIIITGKEPGVGKTALMYRFVNKCFGTRKKLKHFSSLKLSKTSVLSSSEIFQN